MMSLTVIFLALCFALVCTWELSGCGRSTISERIAEEQQETENGTSRRIIGGTGVVRGEFPWQVWLEYKGNYRCGGSIISYFWVLTAAHCVMDYDVSEHRVINASYLRVHAGLKYWNVSRDHQRRRIRTIYLYPYYSPLTFTHDVALLHVYKYRFVFNRGVWPICEPYSRTEQPGLEVLVAGFGITERKEDLSADELQASYELQYAYVKIVSLENCTQLYQEHYTGKNKVTSRHLCAGGGDETDSCHGDSGGALVNRELRDEGFAYFHIGIVSWGQSCAKANFPGVYASTFHYKQWIDEILAEFRYEISEDLKIAANEAPTEMRNQQEATAQVSRILIFILVTLVCCL